MYENIKVIAFDADDTLWINETYFREAEELFGQLMSAYETLNKAKQELFKTQIGNLHLYGYGIKGFVLAMVECATKLSNDKVPAETISKIIEIGKDMFQKPVILLDDIQKVLEELSAKYRLVVATKGDLFDQERKLEKSGLLKYFHHVEVMSDKKEKDYKKLIGHLDIQPNEFLMIGNSLKSDILPLVQLKSNAIHIPFATSWEHEHVSSNELPQSEYLTINSALELLTIL